MQGMFDLATKDRNKKRFKHEKAKSSENDKEFLLDDYESDNETNPTIFIKWSSGNCSAFRLCPEKSEIKKIP